VDATVDIHIIH